jgi:hypothetical protein
MKHFPAWVEKHTDFQELTAEMIRGFVGKILVYKAEMERFCFGYTVILFYIIDILPYISIINIIRKRGKGKVEKT